MGQSFNITEQFNFPISRANLSQRRWLPSGDVSRYKCIEETQLAAADVGAAGVEGGGGMAPAELGGGV
jgi:hypothetical protein